MRKVHIHGGRTYFVEEFPYDTAITDNSLECWKIQSNFSALRISTKRTI